MIENSSLSISGFHRASFAKDSSNVNSKLGKWMKYYELSKDSMLKKFLLNFYFILGSGTKMLDSKCRSVCYITTCAGLRPDRTRLTRVRTELCSALMCALVALHYGTVKCQWFVTILTVLDGCCLSCNFPFAVNPLF